MGSEPILIRFYLGILKEKLFKRGKKSMKT